MGVVQQTYLESERRRAEIGTILPDSAAEDTEDSPTPAATHTSRCRLPPGDGRGCGIETPGTGTLQAMGKTQNLRSPILQSVQTLNSYGIEVVSGIILGLTPTPPRPIAA
jgi:hypothetical protein